MPALKNARHESFCQNMMIHKENATKSYIEAGYDARGNVAEVNASRLLRNAKVQERMAELRDTVEEKDLVTLEEVVGSLKRIAQTAEAADQLAVAKGCWQDLGKVVGAFIDRQEIKANVEVRSPLADEIAELRAKRKTD